jgi:hypothetical protein
MPQRKSLPWQREKSDAYPEMGVSKLVGIIRHVSRFGLAALFLFTAGAKLAIVKTFARNVGELLSVSYVNYQRWMWPTTIAVITVEIVIALLLLLRPTVRIGALLAALLLTGFAAYALYYVYVLHGEPLECGCFGGIIASQLGVKTALRNLALLVPALIVFFGPGRASPLPAQATEVRPATA